MASTVAASVAFRALGTFGGLGAAGLLDMKAASVAPTAMKLGQVPTVEAAAWIAEAAPSAVLASALSTLKVIMHSRGDESESDSLHALTHSLTHSRHTSSTRL